MTARNTRVYGDLGEDYAAKLLKSHNYRILARNYKTKFGEIDIVAEDAGGTLVFIEVKTRWSRKFGKPEEAVTPRKLAKIRKAGEYFTLTHPNLPKRLRIDVVAIYVEKGEVSSAKIIKVN
jgi:putative endonuclease